VNGLVFCIFQNVLNYKDTPLFMLDPYYTSIIKGFITKSEYNENERCKRTFGNLVAKKLVTKLGSKYTFVVWVKKCDTLIQGNNEFE